MHIRFHIYIHIHTHTYYAHIHITMIALCIVSFAKCRFWKLKLVGADPFQVIKAVVSCAKWQYGRPCRIRAYPHHWVCVYHFVGQTATSPSLISSISQSLVLTRWSSWTKKWATWSRRSMRWKPTSKIWCEHTAGCWSARCRDGRWQFLAGDVWQFFTGPRKPTIHGIYPPPNWQFDPQRLRSSEEC